MTNLGLIAEGVTDITAIEHIVGRYLDNSVSIVPIQPKVVMKSGRLKQAETSEGGWAEVMRCCSKDVLSEFFSSNISNQYVIIQVDTDSSEHYGVSPLDANNQKKDYTSLSTEIREKLLDRLGDEGKTLYKDKLIFAICFDEMECWLLPLYLTSLKASQVCTNNCVYKLNAELGKDGYHIDPEEKNSINSELAYEQIYKRMKKKTSLSYMRQHSQGLDEFLSQLDSIEIEEEFEE